MGQGIFGAQKGAAKINCHDPVPVFNLEFMQAPRASGNAGIVDQHIQVTEGGQSLLQQVTDL